MRIPRLWPIEAKLHSIAPKFSFACLALLALAGGLHTVSVEQKWEQARMCMAENIYHEGRGESVRSRYDLGMLTIARISDPDRQWPKTICGVIAQDRQFSWVLDYQLATTRRNDPQWIDAQRIADDLLHNAWSRYVLPRGWECARWYKRSDDKGVSKTSLQDFNAHLFPVGTFDHQTAFQDRHGCKHPLPTQ